jgi:hypothetical protein
MDIIICDGSTRLINLTEIGVRNGCTPPAKALARAVNIILKYSERIEVSQNGIS